MKIFFPIKGVWDYSNGFRAYRAALIKKIIDIFKNDFIELKGLGFTGTAEKLIKLRMFGARIEEIPFELKYDLKQSESKMFSRITIVGYLILIIKYIYPWGRIIKERLKMIKELNNSEKKIE